MQGENENVRSVVYEEAGGIAGGEGEEVEVDRGGRDQVQNLTRFGTGGSRLVQSF